MAYQFFTQSQCPFSSSVLRCRVRSVRRPRLLARALCSKSGKCSYGQPSHLAGKRQNSTVKTNTFHKLEALRQRREPPCSLRIRFGSFSRCFLRRRLHARVPSPPYRRRFLVMLCVYLRDFRSSTCPSSPFRVSFTSALLTMKCCGGVTRL
jgi:hypothetical protein